VYIVERKLHAIRDAAMTGRTIKAAINRIPTTRIGPRRQWAGRRHRPRQA
jgi:pyrimidine operon attenuation protein/uracil phosphoribosyltransferase